MKFKKMKQWTAKEDDIIKRYFHKIPFSRWHGSRFDTIKEKLKKAGYKRTNKSISRRSYRIGLKSHKKNNPTTIITCEECDKKYEKATKYSERDKRQRCPECQKINRGYLDPKRNKEYQRQYQEKWNKKQKI